MSAPDPGSPVKIGTDDFKAIYESGRKAVGRQLILFHVEGDGPVAFAAVASRKIGNAVQRNRAKRLLREAFRTHMGRLRESGAYVLLARAGIREKRSADVAGELEKLLTRLNLLSDAAMSRDGHDR
jgi:ribonuclease P protein component